VHELGFKKCLNKAIESFKNRGLEFGISFDMDSLDISEITATGTPVKGGIHLNDIKDAFVSADLSDLKAFEVVEYNPNLDTETFDDVKKVKSVLSMVDKRIA
jgi:arginase